MSAKTSSKRIIACFVALAIFGVAGIGLSTAKGWGGPGLIPRKAFNPTPSDGATGVPPEDVVLTWSAGKSAVMHDVYFGTDVALVASGSMMVYQGTQADTTFDPGSLELGTTYYWCVDEFAGDGTVTAGEVWCFTTPPYWRVDE